MALRGPVEPNQSDRDAFHAMLKGAPCNEPGCQASQSEVLSYWLQYNATGCCVMQVLNQAYFHTRIFLRAVHSTQVFCCLC